MCLEKYVISEEVLSLRLKVKERNFVFIFVERFRNKKDESVSSVFISCFLWLLIYLLTIFFYNYLCFIFILNLEKYLCLSSFQKEGILK